MITTMDKKEIILNALYEQSGFYPVISGSRFFETNNENSDYDYLCKVNSVSIAFLERNDFKALQVLINQYNLFAVYRNEELNMDCLMLKNPERRYQSMLLLKQFGMGEYLKDKELAKRIFRVITRLEQIQKIGAENVFDGLSI